jgi:DNA-binding transcriptional LysR family regulator
MDNKHEFGLFEAFIKVMETGSISLAASQLFITQPCGHKTVSTV